MSRPTQSQGANDQRSERGAVLPVAALLMVALLLMSAIVVDIGHLSLERRADQTAVDIAAITGAMNRSSDSQLIESVRASLDENLSADFTTADMNTCDADVLPANWTAYPSANCLAHDESWTQLQVRVPTKAFPTAFALLAGITELEHSAFARVYSRQGGLVLPFALSATANGYECLKVGAANVPDNRCSGPMAGNFGAVTFGIWGNEMKGTTKDCTGTSTQFVTNVAQGVDHGLSRRGRQPHGTVDVIDTVSCGAIRDPNAMTTTTGNTPQNLGDGLFGASTFPDNGPSRLRRTGGESWFGTTSVAGATVDDTPLWEFIDTTLSSADNVPQSCYKNQFVGDPGGLNPDNDEFMTALPIDVAEHLITVPVPDRMIKLLERCLAHYEGQAWDDGGAFLPAENPIGCGGLGSVCTDPVFGRDSSKESGDDIVDIQASARFGYTPQLTVDSIPSGNTMVRIDRFRAVFLQRVYGGNCSTSGCPITWDPGVGYSSSTSTGKASALTVFIFPAGILPRGLSDDGALDSIGVNEFIELTR